MKGFQFPFNGIKSKQSAWQVAIAIALCVFFSCLLDINFSQNSNEANTFQMKWETVEEKLKVNRRVSNEKPAKGEQSK